MLGARAGLCLPREPSRAPRPRDVGIPAGWLGMQVPGLAQSLRLWLAWAGPAAVWVTGPLFLKPLDGGAALTGRWRGSAEAGSPGARPRGEDVGLGALTTSKRNMTETSHLLT